MARFYRGAEVRFFELYFDAQAKVLMLYAPRRGHKPAVRRARGNGGVSIDDVQRLPAKLREALDGRD